MSADTLAVAAELTTWAMRGQSATVIAILITLIVIVVRHAVGRERELANEEDAVIAEAAYAPQHPSNRLTMTSRQIS